MADPSARQLRKLLDEERHDRSFVIGFACFSAALVLYLISLVFTVHRSGFVVVPAIVLNGVSIGVLFIIGHDCCHGCYTPGRMTDAVLGRICFLPSLTPFTAWWYGHNCLHHGYTNLRGYDYAWQPLSVSEYRSAPVHRRFLERFYRTIPGLALNWILEIWGRHMILPRRTDWKHILKRQPRAHWDHVFVLGFLGVLVACATWRSAEVFECGIQTALPVGLLLAFIGPFTVWSVLVGVLIFVQHTNPKTIWFKSREEWNFFRGQIRSTAHVELPWPINRLFLNVMEHNAHHVDPAIPLYRLIQQQKHLEDEHRAVMPVDSLSLGLLRRIFRTCQLYDYERHQWVSFDGEPTTNTLLPSEVRSA